MKGIFHLRPTAGAPRRQRGASIAQVVAGVALTLGITVVTANMFISGQDDVAVSNGQQELTFTSAKLANYKALQGNFDDLENTDLMKGGANIFGHTVNLCATGDGSGTCNAGGSGTIGSVRYELDSPDICTLMVDFAKKLPKIANTTNTACDTAANETLVLSLD